MNEFGFALRLLAAFCVIGGVLAGFRTVALALQRGRVRTRSCLVAVLDTAYLPGGASLHVVRAGDRVFVVARCASSVATIAELTTASLRGAGEEPREV